MGAVMQDRVARTLERFEREAETLDEMVQRMTGGAGGAGECEGLPSICRAWDVPYGRVLSWLMADEKRYGVYSRALAMQAKLAVSETVCIADGQPVAVVGPDGKPLYDEDGELLMVERDVARDKLRVETRFRVAKYHDAATYGDKADGSGGGITVVIQRGLGNPSPPPADSVSIESGGQTLTISDAVL